MHADPQAEPSAWGFKAVWMAMAKRNACTGLANSTRNPSPMVLNTRPPWVAAKGSITSVRSVRTRADVSESSAHIFAE